MPANTQPVTDNRQQITVIGAGMAGLNAARLLAAQGFWVTILEAHDRLGGRVYDFKDEGGFEPMGPEFIHGKLPTTFDILAHYGIDIEEQTGDFVMAKGGDLLEEDEDEDQQDSRYFEQALKDLKEDTPVETFLQKFLKDHPGEEAMAAQARSYAKGYFAADPKDFSTFSLREDWLDEHPEGRPKIDYEPQYRPAGGYSALLEAIQQDLENQESGKIEWLLSSAVSAIEWNKGEATITYKTNGKKEETLTCQAVIITVPVGVIARKEGVGTIRFNPDLPEKRKAASDIGTGPVLKVRLDFEKAFWEEIDELKDMGFLLSSTPPVEAFWNDLPRKTPTLTAWVGGPSALPFSGTDEEQVLSACLDSLAAATGVSIEDLWDMLTSFTVSFWGNDPFIPEAYSYDKAGLWDARTRLAETVEGTLFFAGEGTVRARYGGTVEAALESGKRTALELSAALAPSNHGKQG